MKIAYENKELIKNSFYMNKSINDMKRWCGGKD